MVNEITIIPHPYAFGNTFTHFGLKNAFYLEYEAVVYSKDNIFLVVENSKPFHKMDKPEKTLDDNSMKFKFDDIYVVHL